MRNEVERLGKERGGELISVLSRARVPRFCLALFSRKELSEGACLLRSFRRTRNADSQKEKGKTSVKGKCSLIAGWIQESWDVWEKEEIFQEEGGREGPRKRVLDWVSDPLSSGFGKANFSSQVCHTDPCLVFFSVWGLWPPPTRFFPFRWSRPSCSERLVGKWRS